MKKIILLSLFLTTLVNAVPLAGTYFINQDGSEDYNTIALAVADLTSNGISAPVIFKIRTGTYNEQIVINNISRTGAVNDRVVFKRATPSDTVIIKNPSQDSTFNFIFKLSAVKYISFVNLEFEATNADYQHLFEYTGDTDSITIANCIFRGLNYPNSIFNRGELIYSQTNNPSIDATSTGLIFTGNSFEKGYSAISILGSNQPVNTISDNLFKNQAIKSVIVLGLEADSQISNNTFDSSYTRTMAYTALYAEGLGVIKNNEIKLNSIGTAEVGMSLRGAVSSAKLLVYNNTISSTNPVGNSVGADLDFRLKFFHNTIKMEHINDIPVNVSATEADSVLINNNLLINTGFGKTIVAATNANRDAVLELFDNDYYTAGGVVSYWGDLTSYTSVAFFQRGVQPKHPHIGFNKAVTFVNPSTGNLRLFGASIGDKFLVAHPQSDVTEDLDGEVRGVLNTYIGADIPSLAGSAIAAMDNSDSNNGGYYAVSGFMADYSTAQEAFDDLYRRGMKNDVTIKIRDGSFPTNANFYKIVKQNAQDVITITSSSTITNAVLSYSGDSDPNNILRFDGTSHVVIDSIDFDMGVASANGVEFNNSNSTDIKNSTFNGGDIGIMIVNDSTSDNHQISTNTFSNQAINAIKIDSATTLSIEANSIDSNNANFKGIYLSNNTDASTISKNKIQGVGTVIAIYLDNANGEVNNRGLIANNFISTNKGLFVVNSSANWNVYHNSFNTNAAAVVLKKLTGTEPSNFNFTNNIIQTPSTAANMIINETSSTADDNIQLDYNTYYNQVQGTTLFKWYNHNYSSLTSFVNATAMDFNSHERSVLFVDAANNDLHLAAASIGDNNLAGTNVPVVTDIDGDTRASVFPYTGADEAAVALNPARISITSSGLQTSEDGSMTVDISFVLESQPSNNVVVSAASSDTTQGTINTLNMIFTPSNWNTPQTKTVTGVDDNIMEGDINYSIATTVSSADSNYDGLNVADLNLTNIDDDTSANLKLEVVNSMAEPNTAGVVRISLVKPLSPPNDTPLVNTQAISIDFQTSNSSATLGVDYTDASGSVVLPALSSSIDVNVEVIDDNLIEDLEHTIFVLTGKSGGVGFIFINTNTLVQLDIVDDENANVFVSMQVPAQEPTTNGFFKVALDGGISPIDTNITVSFSGVATQGTDYQMIPTSVTIPALASEANIPINVIDDIDSEGNEEINISIDAVDNPLINILAVNPMPSSIFDDDTSADISISITPNNPTFNTATVTNLLFTLSNNSPINIHQAVLQSTEPVGLSYVNWQCLAASQYCTQTAGMGNISEVISIDANSQIQFSVDVLATTTPTASISVQAILNPAPFLIDPNPNNNTAIATSLLEIIFQNGFESSLNKQLYQAVTAFDQQDSLNSYYYFIEDDSAIYHFIQTNKVNNTVRYRHVYVDAIKESINTSDWIKND